MIEGAPESSEHILSRSEVITALERHVKNYTIERELSDDKGLYLIEATIAGEKPGETTEYRYQRKGRLGKMNQLETTIAVVYYEDGIPTGGNDLATYDEGTGLWK